MLRITFKIKYPPSANGVRDHRPIRWPVDEPYWRDSWDKDGAVMVTYAQTVAYVHEHWPEAYDLLVENVSYYQFSERYPKPFWFNPPKEHVL